MTDRAAKAISAFLDQCAHDQIAFEPQRAFTTQAEAEGNALEFWVRFAELHRAIGREPPAWPAGIQSSTEKPLI